MLAISLHATNDELRDELVPLNKKYPLEELMAGIRAYPGLSNARRVTFEYVMLKGVNDSPAEAKALVKLLKGIPAKINLIPFNPWPGTDYECSDWKTIETLRRHPEPRPATPRPSARPRGRDILAACGQLKSESEKLRASARRRARRRRRCGGESPTRRERSAAETPACSPFVSLDCGDVMIAAAQLLSPEIQAFATGFPVILPARGRDRRHPGRWAAALYVLLTPHKEIALIREGNAAAAVSLSAACCSAWRFRWRPR